MTAISYHDTVNDLQDLSFKGRNPFARPEWFAMLEQQGERPFIALARNGDKALALPLVRRDGRLENLTNWYAFTWSGLSTCDAADNAMLADLAKDLKSQARSITLAKLPDENGAASDLQAAFGNAGWFVNRTPCDTNHILPVSGRTYAEYLAGRPGPLRTTLKRKSGKVRITILTQFQSDAWLSYEVVYSQSWKPSEGNPEMLRQFARSEGEAGRLRLGLAHDGETVVAAQVWTVDNGTAYIHKLAHRESASHLSAGTTLTAALFEQVIDRDKVQSVDFGTGNDSYKRDWMEDVRPRFRLQCLDIRRPGNWPTILRCILRQLVSRPTRL